MRKPVEGGVEESCLDVDSVGKVSENEISVKEVHGMMTWMEVAQMKLRRMKYGRKYHERNHRKGRTCGRRLHEKSR